jgi:hypothetical protein
MLGLPHGQTAFAGGDGQGDSGWGSRGHNKTSLYQSHDKRSEIIFIKCYQAAVVVERKVLPARM